MRILSPNEYAILKGLSLGGHLPITASDRYYGDRLIAENLVHIFHSLGRTYWQITDEGLEALSANNLTEVEQ